MFAYCDNNPVNFADPTGTCITNARGDTIHNNCGYMYLDVRGMNNVLASISKTSSVADQGTTCVINITRYACKTAVRPNNVSEYLFKSTKQAYLAKIDAVEKTVEYLYKSIDALIIGTEIFINAYNNYINNQRCIKILWDGLVDLAIMTTSAYMSAKIGAYLGSMAGPGGIALGVCLGVGIGLAIDMIDEKTRRELKARVR